MDQTNENCKKRKNSGTNRDEIVQLHKKIFKVSQKPNHDLAKVDCPCHPVTMHYKYFITNHIYTKFHYSMKDFFYKFILLNSRFPDRFQPKISW